MKLDLSTCGPEAERIRFTFDLPDFTPSQEAVSEDGMEREYVFYGKMVDKSDLERATSYQDQEQYRVFIPSKEKDREITARIRKTLSWYKDDQGEHVHDPVYHLTIKSFLKGEKGCSEAEQELPREQGQKLLDVFRMADPTGGMIKRRYVFPAGQGYFPNYANPSERVGVRMALGDSVWEVDVPKEFRDSKSLDRSEVEDGGCWVKLDYEVKKFDLRVKDNHFDVPFPIRLTDVIYQQPGERDEVTEARVKKAMKQFKPELPKASTEGHAQAVVDAYKRDPVGSVIATAAVVSAVLVIINGVKAVGSMFRRKPSAKNDKRRQEYAKELERTQSEQEKLISLMNRTFLNGDWLDKHRMEMRAVSGRGVVGPLSLNGRFPGAPVAVLQAVKGELQEIDRIVRYLKSKGKAKDPEVYNDFELHADKLLGQVAWKADEKSLDITYAERSDTIAPLSKIDVPNAADLVVDCMKLYMQIDELSQWEKRQHKLPFEWVLADSLLDTARALTRWMGRSVKQGDVGTESLQISLEESWSEASIGEKLKRIFGAGVFLAVIVGVVVAAVAAAHYACKGIDWLFSDHARKDPKTATKVLEMVDSQIDEAIKGIESTYLNRDWMKDAPLASGTISGQGIGNRLSKRGVYNVRALRTNVEHHLRAVEATAQYYKTAMARWATEVNRVANWIHIEAKKLASGHPAATSDVDFLLENAADKVIAAGTPWEKIPLKGDQLLGKVDVARDESGQIDLSIDYDDVGAIPALKADEVSDAAHALVLTLRAIRTCAALFNAVPGVADGEDDTLFSVEVEGEEIWQLMIGRSPLDDVYWHDWRGEAYLYTEWTLMQSLAATADALGLLLKRSVLKKQ